MGERRSRIWLRGGRAATALALVALGGCDQEVFAPGGEEIVAIAIVPEQIALAVGDAAVFQVVAVNQGGQHRPLPPLEWSVSNTAVLSVDANGVVSTHAEGQGQVRVSAGELSDEARVVVGPAPAPEGPEHTCAIAQGGRLHCWGRNANGELGDGTRAGKPAPVPVAGERVWQEVAVGASHTCGLATGGQALCWGRGAEGQIGNGDHTTRLAPDSVVGRYRFRMLAAGSRHTCGIDDQAVISCWGWNTDGQLGVGHVVSLNTPNPISVLPALGNPRFFQVSAGGHHSCALDDDFHAYCWGNNQRGQLGDGTRERRLRPVRVATDLRFVDLALGRWHTCGVDTGGKVWCWGGNDAAQFGNGRLEDSPLPVPAANVSMDRHSAGAGHTCGVAHGGALWCWGAGGFGQIGGSLNTLSGSPVQVSNNYHFWVFAGAAHTCAVRADGTAWCWGFGGFGQLGNGSYANVENPVQVAGDVFWTGLAR